MLKRLREKIAPLITAIVGVLAWNVNRSVAVLDTEIKTWEQMRLETAADRDLHFRIYEAVTTSLQTTDVRRQRVAKTLVLAMLEPEDTLRSGLPEVLSAEGSEEIRGEASAALSELASYAAEQSDLPRLAPSINASPGYRIQDLVIRREAGEESAALEAKRIADAAVGATSGGFVLATSTQGTPNYLSLFVCQ